MYTAQRSKEDPISTIVAMSRSVLGAILRALPADAPQRIYSTILSPRPIRVPVNAILRRLAPKSVLLDGKKLFLNPDDVVVAGALSMGIFEDYPREIFRSEVEPGSTVVDVGANIGVYTLTAQSAGARVIAYEPDEKNREVLSRSLTENNMDDVTIRAEALGNTTGTATFYLHPDNTGKHSLLDSGEHSGVVTVPLIPLDDSLRALGVAHVDVVKIDVEGYEAQVLEGAANMLQRDKPVLFFEFAPERIRFAGKDPAAMLASLSELGYKISVLDERARSLSPIEDFDKFVRDFSRKDDYVNVLAKISSPIF